MANKDLEGKTAKDIILDMKDMSARPEYYSGCGATCSDLDSGKLERIYKQVTKEHGEGAGNQFIQMVADIPVLSATDFLLSFYKLGNQGWEWNKGLLGNEKGIDVGQDYGDGRREAIGMATIASGLDWNNIDETPAIRVPFLKKHGIELPEDINDFYRRK